MAFEKVLYPHDGLQLTGVPQTRQGKGLPELRSIESASGFRQTAKHLPNPGIVKCRIARRHAAFDK
jgi:hypothetical protein